MYFLHIIHVTYFFCDSCHLRDGGKKKKLLQIFGLVTHTNPPIRVTITSQWTHSCKAFNSEEILSMTKIIP